jgi:rhodanese-related sulfurtransferase
VKPVFRGGQGDPLLLQKAVLIDTRSQERFARAHIPRSLNLAAFSIKTRVELRDRLLVLVDEGFAPGLLLEEATELRRSGFSHVIVLDGGLAAWVRQGGTAEGLQPSALAATSVSASDFVRTRRNAEWRVLEMERRAPGISPLDFAIEQDRGGDISKRLAALSASAAGRQAPRILIIAPEGEACARIEARLGAANTAPIYYLSGGRVALDSYRAEQAALVQQPHQLIQLRPNRGLPISAGGCSTCPKSRGL